MLGLFPTKPHSAVRRAERGFTLIELMTVVIMITIFAAIAIPLMTQQMRERRAQHAAERVAELYRGARLRAMGRGSAILVRFSPGTRGRFEVNEAQRGATAESGCESLPISSCLTPDWNAAGDDPAARDFRNITVLDLAQRGEYDRVTIQMKDQADTGLSELDVCFSPMGRAFARTTPSGRFQPLTATHVAEVFRAEGATRIGRTRRVVILPNGTSRIQ